MEFNNTNIKRKNPINRNSLFFSKESYDYEVQIGQEYLKSDLNTTIVLFQVDLEKTNLDSVYHESKKDSIRFKTPVELHAFYNIDEADLRNYMSDKNLGAYRQLGNLEFWIYEKELEENNCTDMRRGDFIGIQLTPEVMEYFQIFDSGEMPYSNKETLYGYSSFYRSCKASWVDPNIFNGK